MTEYRGTDNLEAMAKAENYNKFLVKLVLSHAMKGDHILDFGAGIGTYAELLSKKGHIVHCVEPDQKQAHTIAKLGLPVYDSLEQIDDNSLDYLYSMNVLEHINDDQMILHLMNRKLKPGGRLLLYVPAFEILFSSMDSKVGHYRRYTRYSLARVAQQAGFTVISSRYTDAIGFVLTLLYKLVGSKSGDLNVRALVLYDRFLFPLNRIMDKLLGSFIGKNVLIVCVK